jgi:hypothetical protein
MQRKARNETPESKAELRVGEDVLVELHEWFHVLDRTRDGTLSRPELVSYFFANSGWYSADTMLAMVNTHPRLGKRCISRGQWFDLILHMHRNTPELLTVPRIRHIRSKFEIPVGTRPNYAEHVQGRLLKDIGKQGRENKVESAEKTEDVLAREAREQEEAEAEMKRLEAAAEARKKEKADAELAKRKKEFELAEQERLRLDEKATLREKEEQERRRLLAEEAERLRLAEEAAAAEAARIEAVAQAKAEEERRLLEERRALEAKRIADEEAERQRLDEQARLIEAERISAEARRLAEEKAAQAAIVAEEARRLQAEVDEKNFVEAEQQRVRNELAAAEVLLY